jgi:hypothetical protein
MKSMFIFQVTFPYHFLVTDLSHMTELGNMLNDFV